MDIIVAIPEKEYHMIVKQGKKIIYKWHDEQFDKLYCDIQNRNRVSVGDAIFFYMYGCVSYYAIITEIQLRLIPERIARIYFDKIIEIKDKLNYKLAKFQGVRYIYPDGEGGGGVEINAEVNKVGKINK